MLSETCIFEYYARLTFLIFYVENYLNPQLAFSCLRKQRLGTVIGTTTITIQCNTVQLYIFSFFYYYCNYHSFTVFCQSLNRKFTEASQVWQFCFLNCIVLSGVLVNLASPCGVVISLSWRKLHAIIFLWFYLFTKTMLRSVF